MAKKGISVKLPLSTDKIDGPYVLNKTLDSTIRQNLKMLVLTEPGERVMNGNFGVGLKRLLFEPVHPTTYERIKERIMSQTSLYLPFINIKDVVFSSNGPQVKVSIIYSLGDFEREDVLTISQVID
tara:strand:+ start:430 stop:807 length:378 start_codon:yes stop_codon:yes gene_type:complete